MRQNKEEIARKEFLKEEMTELHLESWVGVSQSGDERGGTGFQAERATEAKALRCEIACVYGENL